MADNLSRNQDFSKAFLAHPLFFNAVIYIKNTGSLALYNQIKGLFEILDPEDAEDVVYRFMLTCSRKSVSMSVVSDVIEQIKCLTDRKVESAFSPLLALTDCLLNMDTFQLVPFGVEHNVFFGLPFASTDLTLKLLPTSRFAKFLDQVLITDQGSPDQELIALVQEMFGYCLLTSNICEASFFLVGDGSNGKSVLLRLLEHMVGSKFCSSLSVESMTTSPHATTALVGKRLNICTEEESAFVKSDKFKSLVSGEPTEINYKFGKIKSARLPVKYLFATNELPTFSGFNHGLLRRIKIIPFKRTFTDKEQDRQLTPKLLVELPAITAWALEGAKRLVANSYKLSQAAASDSLRLDFESNLSAAVAFVREEYKEQPGEFMFYSDLYARFTEWCKEVGKKQMSRQRFTLDINRVCKLEPTQKWNPNTNKPERGRPLVRIGGTPIKTVDLPEPTFDF